MLPFWTKINVKALSAQEECKEYLNSIETLKMNLLILGRGVGNTQGTDKAEKSNCRIRNVNSRFKEAGVNSSPPPL
jgi:hypothetical protein